MMEIAASCGKPPARSRRTVNGASAVLPSGGCPPKGFGDNGRERDKRSHVNRALIVSALYIRRGAKEVVESLRGLRTRHRLVAPAELFPPQAKLDHETRRTNERKVKFSIRPPCGAGCCYSKNSS
jgi:hypothetical protein